MTGGCLLLIAEGILWELVEAVNSCRKCGLCKSGFEYNVLLMQPHSKISLAIIYICSQVIKNTDLQDAGACVGMHHLAPAGLPSLTLTFLASPSPSNPGHTQAQDKDRGVNEVSSEAKMLYPLQTVTLDKLHLLSVPQSLDL